MLAIVQQMLPGANINSQQVNRNVQCAPHRDARNSSLPSFILCFGEFEGGALVLEDGRRFEERNVGHSFDGRSITHRNEPILPNADGVMMKYSIVAYSHSGTTGGAARKRTKVHWLRALLLGCKRMLRILNGSTPSGSDWSLPRNLRRRAGRDASFANRLDRHPLSGIGTLVTRRSDFSRLRHGP